MSINPRISLADLTATVHADPSSDLLYGGGTSIPHCRAKALPPTISNYTFNARNQLVTYTKQDENNRTVKILEFTYDAFGRRVSKTEDNTTQKYLYDGDDIVAIFDEQNQVIATITHDESIDTPLSITNQNGTFYYHRDHQGSIVALTDSSGQVVESFTYDNHYGTIVDHTKTTETNNPYGYTGREIDADDLYYYRARYYDPTIQRFLSEDPIGFDSGDFNWYRYTLNNPVNYIDPSGLFDMDCLKKCAIKHYLPASIGAPLVGGGLPLVGKEKAAGAFGSSQNTSWFSSKFGSKGKFGRWPTFTGFPPRLKWTPYFGRAAARWLPFVGWGLLGYDAYKIYQCMDRCENNECQ